VGAAGGGAELALFGHAAAGLPGGVGFQFECVGDGGGFAAGVIADKSQDQGAGVFDGVVGGGTVEFAPRPGGGVEAQGVVGFFDVAAGHVQHGVGLAACPVEDHDGVGGAGESVGAGHLRLEVLGALFADVMDKIGRAHV